MKKVYTWTAKPAKRSVTIADMQAAKGKRQWTQVTANTAEEAAAAASAGLDMIICNGLNTATVRQGNNTLFLTAALGFPDFATNDDIMRMAMKCLGEGADAILTARSMDVVSMLAREDVPVMGHLGLVPRKSTWFGGLRAVGKNAAEAHDLYHKFKRLEDAGAVLVEAEVIPAAVMAEISKRSGLLTVSLGSGKGCDINYQFMEDLCGDAPSFPRHARPYANLHALREKIKSERVRALNEFHKDAMAGNFPGKKEEAGIDKKELEKFREMLESEGN